MCTTAILYQKLSNRIFLETNPLASMEVKVIKCSLRRLQITMVQGWNSSRSYKSPATERMYTAFGSVRILPLNSILLHLGPDIAVVPTPSRQNDRLGECLPKHIYLYDSFQTRTWQEQFACTDLWDRFGAYCYQRLQVPRHKIYVNDCLDPFAYTT